MFTEAEMTEKLPVRISYEDKGHKGRFVAHVTGIDGEGELSISKASDVLVIADHTYAPDALRGTGAALALVEALIADARAKAYRVVPLCPFVRAQSLKHPEWADVIQQ
jgi:predicted GNAT family acetyltransferase